MGETNDLARQRLTRFLAARLDARQREAKDAQRAAPCSGAPIPSRTEEKSSQIARDVDSSSRATP
jgi:hypothetical protein